MQASDDFQNDFQQQQQQTRTVLRSAAHEHFREVVNIFGGGFMNAGVHEFSFSYQLPGGLPSTFFLEGRQNFGLANAAQADGPRYKAEIIYYAYAHVDTLLGSLSTGQRLVVGERFNLAAQPSSGKNSKNFMTAKGHLAVDAALNSNAYFPGNSIVARVTANNTSSKSAKSMTMVLQQKTILNANGRTFETSTGHFSQQGAGFDAGFYGVRFVPCQIPVDAQPTTHSQFVTNEVSWMRDVDASSLTRFFIFQYVFFLNCRLGMALDLNVPLPTTICAPQYLFASTLPQKPPVPDVPKEVSLRAKWQPDGASASCTACRAGFTLIKRRHHCRHCGALVCGACSSNKFVMPNIGVSDAARVCNGCVPHAKQGGKALGEMPDFIVEQQQLSWSPSK